MNKEVEQVCLYCGRKSVKIYDEIEWLNPPKKIFICDMSCKSKI